MVVLSISQVNPNGYVSLGENKIITQFRKGIPQTSPDIIAPFLTHMDATEGIFNLSARAVTDQDVTQPALNTLSRGTNDVRKFEGNNNFTARVLTVVTWFEAKPFQNVDMEVCNMYSLDLHIYLASLS